jgi:hypothetical protein
MRVENWQVGARLMDKWLAAPAYQMPDAVKRGRVPAPRQAIDTGSVTLAWALRVPRVAAAHSTLLSTWSTGERRARSIEQIVAQFRRWIATGGVDVRRPFRFGDLSRPVPEVDQRCAINREIVTSNWHGTVDDFYAAFGNALVRLAVSGLVTPVDGGWRIVVDQVGTYLRDSYDFNGDQPLGSWGRSGFSRVAVLAAEIAVDAREAESFWRRGVSYFTVSNGSFRRFRTRTGRGGDYMIFSDLRRTALARPISVAVPA